jgi:segregation and condensation protein B
LPENLAEAGEMRGNSETQAAGSGGDATVPAVHQEEEFMSEELRQDRNMAQSKEPECDQPTLFDAQLSDEELMASVEAILFSMGESVEISAIAKALEVRTGRIRQILQKLQKQYAKPSRGIMLQQFDDAVQMSTKPEQYQNLIKIAKVPRKMTLSDSVIETLSIIAYKQPITKIEVEGIRGVSCDYAINKLLEYDLIKELGRKDAPGRPILFGTTEQFLRSFGVKNLAELPSLDAVQVEEFKEEAEAEVNDRLGV